MVALSHLMMSLAFKPLLGIILPQTMELVI